MIGTIVLKPYIGILSQERDLIIILCTINILFSIYYFWNAIRLEYIFRLENKIIIKFGKVIGIATSIYLPHAVIFATLFFKNLHNLVMIMVTLIILMEITLIALVFKEVYDLVFLEETRRNFEIEAERKKYLEREKKPIPGDKF